MDESSNFQGIVRNLLINFTTNNTEVVREAEHTFSEIRSNHLNELLISLFQIVNQDITTNIGYSALIQLGLIFSDLFSSKLDNVLTLLSQIELFFIQLLQNIKINENSNSLPMIERNYIIKVLEKCILQNERNDFIFLSTF